MESHPWDSSANEPGTNGGMRYQALYDDVKGHRRSAGTFVTEARPTRAWQRAEDRQADGRVQRHPPHPAAVPPLRRGAVVAAPRDGSPHPRDLHLLPEQAHPAGVRVDADQRDPTRRRPRMGHRSESRRGLPDGDPAMPHHPVRGVHHRVQRPDHPPAPVPRREDPAGGEEAADDHHPRPVRPALHRPAHRPRPADGRGADRVRAALGRTHRTPPDRPQPADADAHRQPGRGRARRQASTPPAAGS